MKGLQITVTHLNIIDKMRFSQCENFSSEIDLTFCELHFLSEGYSNIMLQDDFQNFRLNLYLWKLKIHTVKIHIQQKFCIKRIYIFFFPQSQELFLTRYIVFVMEKKIDCVHVHIPMPC